MCACCTEPAAPLRCLLRRRFPALGGAGGALDPAVLLFFRRLRRAPTRYGQLAKVGRHRRLHFPRRGRPRALLLLRGMQPRASVDI